MSGVGANMDVGEDHPILDFLEREVPADPRQRVFVVAPTPDGAAALRRALTERRGALLGVDFVTAAGLARGLLTIAGVPFTADVPDPLEEREDLRALLPDTSVGRYAVRFPGALAHLLDTVRELHTLGPLRPDDSLSRSGADVLAIAGAVEARGGQRGGQRGGRSRWVAAATQAIARQAGALPDRVLVVGYPDPERDLQLLLEVLHQRDVPVVHAPAATHTPRADLHSCPHVAAELRLAARICLDAAARGIPWHDMVIAAPRLDPYLDHLRHAFDTGGVPFHTAAATPLIRHPRAALALHLCRLLFETAPRPSFLALASSALLRNPVAPDHLAALDRLSRRDSLIGTGAETSTFLDKLASRFDEADRGRPAPVVSLLRDVIRAATSLRHIADYRQRSTAAEEFMSRHLVDATPEDQDISKRISDCLAAVVFAGAGDPDGTNYTAELHDLLRTRTAPLRGSTPGGVQFVPFAGALAFPCTVLHMLGLSADIVPGPSPLHTFLDDSDRESIGMRTTDRQRESEAHLLGRLAQHAPTLTVSYPRTDAEGRLREFTLWSDRIDRFAPLSEEIREPGHPESRAADAVASGRCPPDLALDHLALGGCTDAKVFAQLLDSDAARILARVDALESFDGSSLRRDGDIGSAYGDRVLRDPVSVTAVQTLGRCPQQFLFAHVMGISPLPEEPDPLSLPRDRIGTLIHRVIETLYQEFLPRLMASTEPHELLDEMSAQAGARFERELAGDTSMLRRQFPGLHDLLRQRWLAGLIRAIDGDLELMRTDESRPESVEREIQQTLYFRRPGDEEPVRLLLRGKLDRVDRLEDGGVRILDFKTGARPEASVDAKNIYKGTNLQLVLYAMLERAVTDLAPSALEARSIRPVGGIVDPPDWRHELSDADAYLVGEHAAGLEETMAVLVRLIRRGLLTPKPDRHCAWCKFKPACRRFHPPSVQRVSQCSELELHQYYALARKSSRDKLLHHDEEILR
jgi:putative RecB family exonuclease